MSQSITLQEHCKTISLRLQIIYSDREANQLSEWLHMQCAGIESRAKWLVEKERNVSAKELECVDAGLERLLTGEPIQYIIGQVEFCDLLLKVDHRALIPRPETEEMMELARRELEFVPKRILDLCSGSGCLALAASNYFPSADVIGLELSDEALALSKENNRRLGMNVTFLNADVLALSDDLLLPEQDLILTNPPYIPQSEGESMDRNVTDFEPPEALFVSDDEPLIFYKRIAELAHRLLKDGGLIWCEIHHRLGEDCLKLFSEFSKAELREDFYGNIRFIKAKK